MADLHQIHEYLRPGKRSPDELARAAEGLNVEELFDDPRPAKLEPAWLLWCRLHERALGDIAVILTCLVAPLVLWILGVVG